jgi:hypothetical protein
MTWATITGPGTTTATKFHGDIMNKHSNLYNGTDISDTVTIHANTLWTMGNQTMTGRFQTDKGADVASPAGGIMTLGTDGNVFDVTGTNTINEILGTTWTLGAQIVLQFDGVLTVTHNSGGTNDILLGNAANMTTAAGNTLSLFFDGTDWVETARNVGDGAGDALTANGLDQFAATTSLELLGVISDETGTGSLVFATSPTLVTPLLGTPTSGVLTNTTGYPGDSSLVTVGTVASGTWQGTAVASAYLDADTAHLGVAQAFTADKTFNDNVNATFGTGGDADIDYDGTDMKINPQVVGSGNLDITAGNLDVLTGTVQEAGVDISPIGLHDTWIPVSAVWPATTLPCGDLTKRELATYDVDIQTMAFTSTTADEVCQCSWTMPKEWDGGTVTAEFIWTALGGSAGNVRWGIQGVAFANDDALDAAFGNIQEVTDAWIANDDQHTSAATPALTIAGSPAAGEMVQFKFLRSGSDAADTFATTAELIGVRINYTTDSAQG